MFIKVSRQEEGLAFTVVDLIGQSKEQEPKVILELGTVPHGSLNGVEAWYVIAESLLASTLPVKAKIEIAKDAANWLPPLSREILLKRRGDDLKQIQALSEAKPDDGSAAIYGIPPTLSEKDPLTIVADWLSEK